MKDIRARGRDFAVLIAIGAFLAFINPYDATGDLPYPLALLYWTGMILVGGLMAEAAMFLYRKWLQPGPVIGMLAVAAISSAFAVSSFIIAIEHFFASGVALNFWLPLYGLVLVISIAVTLIGFTVDRAFNDDGPEQIQAPDPTETFMQRLPIKHRQATLHAIASEDHYLRVYTSAGEELILMRLTDAVRELAEADGLQVHRSWWIAREGLVEEVRRDGRSLLRLPSGTEVPVSRSYRKTAKAAGFIA
ncbi:MAG: LytTR family DNA-binding domain-containing protein [Pseudomonadota bacterium]